MALLGYPFRGLRTECDDARAVTAMLMAGGGTGFAASFLGSRSGVTPGFARALTDGMLWGAAIPLRFFSSHPTSSQTRSRIRTGRSNH